MLVVRVYDEDSNVIETAPNSVYQI
jgi:hypothetical protein